jgi:Cu/Ag efflux protein CusF
MVAPPSPVSKFIEEPDRDGIFDRFQATVAGRLSDVTITVESLDDDKKTVTIQAEPADMVESSSQVLRFKLVQGINEIPDSITVKRGDKIVLRVIEGNAKGIWWSYNYSVADEVGRA